MFRLEHIAYQLEREGYGIRGQDIFIHHMPSDCVRGLAILPPIAGDEIDWELEGWSRTRFQIIVRNPSVVDALTIAEEINALFTIKIARVFPSLGNVPPVNIKRLLPCKNPIVYPRMPSGNLEVSLNFECAYTLT